jgi:hypothetical protein
MPRQVDIEGFGLVEVADDWTPDEVLAFAEQQMAPRAAAQPPVNLRDPSARQIPDRLAMQSVAGGPVQGLPPVVPGAYEQAAGRFVQGTAGAIAGIPESVAIVADKIGQTFPSIDEGKSLQELDTHKLGQSIRQGAARLAPIDPNRPKSFIADTLPQAAGSMAGFLAGGAVGRVAKIPAVASTALLGAATSGADAYDEALRSGATDDQAWTTFLVNAGAGTTEAVPLARWLGGINRASGGALIRAVKEGSEEAAQEILQQFVGNVNARDIAGYDPNRQLSEGMVEGGGAGAILGTAMSLLFPGKQSDFAREAVQNIQNPVTPPTTGSTPAPPVSPTLGAEVAQLLAGALPARDVQPTPGTIAPAEENRLREQGVLPPTTNLPAANPLPVAQNENQPEQTGPGAEAVAPGVSLSPVATPGEAGTAKGPAGSSAEVSTPGVPVRVGGLGTGQPATQDQIFAIADQLNSLVESMRKNQISQQAPTADVIGTAESSAPSPVVEPGDVVGESPKVSPPATISQLPPIPTTGDLNREQQKLADASTPEQLRGWAERAIAEAAQAQATAKANPKDRAALQAYADAGVRAQYFNEALGKKTIPETPTPAPVAEAASKGSATEATPGVGGSAPSLTPMMQQYQRIKSGLKEQGASDAILAYRLGDFYEFFFEDAKAAAKKLNIALTKRSGVDMAGIPYHAAQKYFKQLTDQGQRVAVVDATDAPGATTRKVTEMLEPTPTIQGMGAAIPEEFQPGGSPTSIKNAKVDEERAKRGLPPAMQPAKRTFGTVWDEAMSVVDATPTRQDALIDELKTSPRAVTDLEDALLLHRQVDLQNDYSRLTAELSQAYDDAKQYPERMMEVKDLEGRVEFLRQRLTELYDVNKAVGTATGRGLNARKMLANEDFTLARMDSEAKAAKGEKLTEEESAQVKRLQARIAELEKAAEEAAQKGAEAAAERGVQEAIGRAKNFGAREQAAPTDRISKAKARLKTAKEEGATQENLGSLIQQLARGFVEKGIDQRDALVDAVFAELTDLGFKLTRRETMDAISGYGDFKQLTKDEVSVKLRDLKGQLQQVAKLEDMAAGQAPSKTGIERRQPSDEERRLIKQVEDAKRRGGFKVTDPERQLRSALEAKKTRLRNQISDLEAQIASKEKIVKERTASPEDAETDALRKRRDELKAEFDEVFQEDVAAYKKVLQRQIAEYERRAAEGDFAPRTRKEPPVNREILRLRAQAEQAKIDWLKLKAKWLLARRDTFTAIKENTLEFLLSARNVKTSFDVSAPGRQGIWLGLGNPIRALRDLAPMFKALSSEKRAMEIEQEIRSRKNFETGAYERAKLYIAPLNASSLTAMEEAMMGNWAQRIPGVRASNRAYITFLNRLRVDTFDAMQKTAEAVNGGPMTKGQEQALANYINVATGRGNLGKLSVAATPMAQVFFSPRLLASRIQLLTGQPFYHGDGLTRKMVAREYAKTMLGASLVLTLGTMAIAALTGDDEEDIVETDPRSSDFLKLRYKNTRVDVLGGLPQMFVFLARLASGEKLTAKDKEIPLRSSYRLPNLWRGRPHTDEPKFGGDKASSVAGRFLRTKLAPAPGAIFDLLDQENVIGEEAKPGRVALDQFQPLLFNDIKDSLREDYSAGEVTALTTMALFGFGTQTYDEKEKRKN